MIRTGGRWLRKNFNSGMGSVKVEKLMMRSTVR